MCRRRISSRREDLPTFQPALYDALLKLSRGYHQIRKERERLIGCKQQLSTTWHAKRQRTLAARQEVIVRAIRAGRALGDAFAWFFYRNDPALLDQHLQQPAPSLPPAGDGGEGELALIAAVRFFGGKYILFHGITTMFRLGDASLVDLETQRIVGIGELKTKRLGPNRLSMHFVAIMPREQTLSKVGATPNSMERPSPKQQAQLDKQLARISKAAVAAQRSMALTMPSWLMSALASVVNHLLFISDQSSELTMWSRFRSPGRGGGPIVMGGLVARTMP